jgi:hypothetical protein
LDGNHLVLPFPWIRIGVKAPEKREACSQSPDSTCLHLFNFHFLTFNKLHLYPHVLRWMGHKEFGSLLITDSISQQHFGCRNKSNITCPQGTWIQKRTKNLVPLKWF